VAYSKVGQVTPQVTTFVANGLTGGVTYNFIIVPSNVEGEAVKTESNVLIYLASQVPDQPIAATTVLETNVNVMIQWTAPIDNYMAIDRYQVLIGTHNGEAFIETKALCDGSKSYVMSVRTCIVPIASLILPPYNLERLELIKV